MTDTALKPCPECDCRTPMATILDKYGNPTELVRCVECKNVYAIDAIPAKSAQLPQDVVNLVIAAREVAYEDFDPEKVKALDKAVEPFGERVPWDNEPDATDEELYQMACDLHEDSVNANLLPPHPHPVETVQADVQPVAIQRYDSSNSCGEGIMVPHPNGDYVEYDHHATAIAQLEAERDGAIAEMERIKAINVKHCEAVNTLLVDGSSWQKRAEKAEASLAECQREKERLRAIIDKIEALPECELKSTDELGDWGTQLRWWKRGTSAQKRAMISQFRAALNSEGA